VLRTGNYEGDTMVKDKVEALWDSERPGKREGKMPF
jgi:hypothetical protein